MTETNPQKNRPPCSSSTLEYDCSGCTDRHSEGTHQGCTKQHGHVGCELDTVHVFENDSDAEEMAIIKAYATYGLTESSPPQENTCCPECKAFLDCLCLEHVPHKVVCANGSCTCHQLLGNSEQLTSQAEVTQVDVSPKFKKSHPAYKAGLKDGVEAEASLKGERRRIIEQLREGERMWLIDTIAKCHTTHRDPAEIRFLLKERLLTLGVTSASKDTV